MIKDPPEVTGVTRNLLRDEVKRSELMALLKQCRADAEVIFHVEVDASTEPIIGFVHYCVTDNVIYLYEIEPDPSDFAQEEKERDIKIYETRRADNFVETAYMEN